MSELCSSLDSLLHQLAVKLIVCKMKLIKNNNFFFLGNPDFGALKCIVKDLVIQSVSWNTWYLFVFIIT